MCHLSKISPKRLFLSLLKNFFVNFDSLIYIILLQRTEEEGWTIFVSYDTLRLLIETRQHHVCNIKRANNETSQSTAHVEYILAELTNKNFSEKRWKY